MGRNVIKTSERLLLLRVELDGVELKRMRGIFCPKEIARKGMKKIERESERKTGMN